MSRDGHSRDGRGADPEEEPTSSGVSAAGSPADEIREIPDPEEEPSTAEEGRSSRVLKFARKLMDRRELAEDTKVLLSAVLNTSDKAKTEAVRLMAREFRSYLKELRLKEDLIKLATSHSLEISISLKPLASRDDDEEK